MHKKIEVKMNNSGNEAAPAGTQNPKLPICVPKLTDREVRDSAPEKRL